MTEFIDEIEQKKHQALRDISDALIYQQQGRAVSFMPPSAKLTYDKQECAYTLALPMYGTLVIIFYIDFSTMVDDDMYCMMCSVEQNQTYSSTSFEEEGVLYEMFEALQQEGYINEECKVA